MSVGQTIIKFHSKGYVNMDFYKVIEKRVSNKSFKTTPIPKETLDKIINAALMAPSWKNNTSYSFIFVTDSRQKEEISSLILNDSASAKNAVKQAPVTAVIVADPFQSGEISNKPYYMVDCGIAMEHLVLASTNEGYGTCWIGSFNEDGIRTVLNIPTTHRVVAMTPIGETDETPEHYPPKDISGHIFYNNWNNTNS